ncbi:MAG TPA: hypothetical protein VE986_07585, partial [Hyphomicrobiales bacterium]|nr:hypothetical protein [Hyphomicrobiales bacterium]
TAKDGHIEQPNFDSHNSMRLHREAALAAVAIQRGREDLNLDCFRPRFARRRNDEGPLAGIAVFQCRLSVNGGPGEG